MHADTETPVSLKGRLFILDTETTGLYPPGTTNRTSPGSPPDQMVELALVEIIDGRVTGKYFSTFVNPGIPIPVEAQNIHQISDEMVASAPRYDDPFLEKAVRRFLASEGPFRVVSHNARFDKGFVPWLANDPNIKWDCSLELARKVWPGAPKHKNDILAEWLGLSIGIPVELPAHRALRDAFVTAAVYIRAEQEHAKMVLSNNPLDRRLPVGFKDFKGERVGDIPPSYARWVLEELDGFDAELKKAFEIRAKMPQPPLTLGVGKHANTPISRLPIGYAVWAIKTRVSQKRGDIHAEFMKHFERFVPPDLLPTPSRKKSVEANPNVYVDKDAFAETTCRGSR